MRITKRRQQRYRRELDELSDAAGSYVQAFLNASRAENPDASVAEIRDAAIEAIEDTLNIFGDEAGQAACDLFDEIMEAEGGKARADQELTTERDYIDEKVRYFARDLVQGSVEGFDKKVADLTRYYVKREAYENMVRNCDRKKVRFARVPSGVETCAFCFMLSSRGFVYHSELTAKGRSLHGMHEHCDCIIVPGIGGETQIAGYDPDEMYGRWKQCAETAGADASDYSKKSRSKILAEVSRRDFRWLYSGVEPEIDYSLQPRDSFGVFKEPGDYSRENLVLKLGEKEPNEWRDLFVHDTLAKHGIRMKPRPSKAYGPNGKEMQGVTNPDIEIDGVMWEIKSPRDGKKPPKKGNETDFVQEALKQAKRNFKNPYDYNAMQGMGEQKKQTRVVLNTRYKAINLNAKEIEKRIIREMKEQGIEEVIWLNGSGEMRRYKNK